MKHCDVVLGFLLPSNENTPEAVHPAVGTLHHPAAGFESGASFDQLGLLTARPNMGGEPELPGQVANLVIVISLVQTQILALVETGPRSFDWNTLHRFAHELEVIDIGPGDGQSDRNAVRLGQ